MNTRSGNRAPPTFSKAQRAELSTLLVTTEQMAQLEKNLNYCRAMLRRPPRMADVRDEIKHVGKLAAEAAKALSRINKAGTHASALFEAQQRLAIQSMESGGDGEFASDAVEVLHRIERLAKLALGNLSPEMRRNRVAWQPVARIYDALVLGWGMTHNKVSDGSDEEPLLPPAQEPRPFPHVPSVGITSSFRKIVGICYTAIDAQYTDPERAIKAFVQLHHARQRR